MKRPLTFKAYCETVLKMAVYPNIGSNLGYPTLGLVGELGEAMIRASRVAERVKKILRDKGGKPLKEDIEFLEKELGDTLWYISAVSSEIGSSLEKVAQRNIQKLTRRKKEGTLKGSGDNR